MPRPAIARSTTLGEFLVQQRKEQAYSIASLAKKAGVSASSLSELERGNRQLTPRMAGKLAGPLGLTRNALFIKANLTPEFDWGKALAGERRILDLSVTEEEEHQIRQYLNFLRLEKLVSKRKQVVRS